MIDIQLKKEMQENFLNALANPAVGGNITMALEKSGTKRSTAYKWKYDDPEFSQRWDEIVKEAKITFKEEAEYALRKGVLSGNMTAVIFALKNLDPKNWSERVKLEGGALFSGEEVGTYEEYVAKCKQIGIDPETGLRVDNGEGEME